MRVELNILPDESILIQPAGNYGGGSIAGEGGQRLRPGESFAGWKYSRLKKLGDGEHTLLRKDDDLRSDPLVADVT